MVKRPERYLEIVFGLMMKVYRYYREFDSLARDPMTVGERAILTRKNFDHLIGGEGLKEPCMLRHAGIVVRRENRTVLAYPDAEAACSHDYQWFTTQQEKREEDR